MSILQMYNDFREKFPEITMKADAEHAKVWGDVDPEFAYSWFESLANAINREMTAGVNASNYKPHFEYFRSQYMIGDSEVRGCIDVSFVENLFWQVQPSLAKPYWQALPPVLNKLYLNFHGRSPAGS